MDNKIKLIETLKNNYETVSQNPNGVFQRS